MMYESERSWLQHVRCAILSLSPGFLGLDHMVIILACDERAGIEVVIVLRAYVAETHDGGLIVDFDRM